MAQHSPGSTGKQLSHPPPVAREFISANRIDPAPNPMQAPASNAVLNRLRTQPKPHKLPITNHPVLRTSQPPRLDSNRVTI